MMSEPHAARSGHVSQSTRTVGLWSAVVATVCSLSHVIGQLAEWLGWIGSRGGPKSTNTPLGIVVLLTPSLLLGSAFLVLVASIHQVAPPNRRIWSHSALGFATVYAVLISTVYFVQFTLIALHLASGRMDQLEPFRFVPFDSFLYAVDILGYSFMSLATLFGARALSGSKEERLARFLTANGLLLPFIALQMYVHPLIWIASLRTVTFPGATWTLALYFTLGLTARRPPACARELSHAARNRKGITMGSTSYAARCRAGSSDAL